MLWTQNVKNDREFGTRPPVVMKTQNAGWNKNCITSLTGANKSYKPLQEYKSYMLKFK